ncbi:MAG: hypothetical protein AUI14_09415 [Actinobacteria bacterium 13_2_20CM_2_71_6]|nr:MAG: hypothetical protein AUI14_09415 [Actinobacteria bacterium 13_2_20CM_2_71_6]
MSPLEQRYRFVLRALPAPYRAVWEEEMVTTFLESMRRDDPEEADFVAEYGRPSWSEVASVATLAVRLRLPALRLRFGGTGAPPRSVVWGDAVRLAALVVLFTHAVNVVFFLGIKLWVAGQLPWLPEPGPLWTLPVHMDWWQRVEHVAWYAWLPAFLALLLRQRRVSQVLVLLVVVARTIATAAQVASEARPVTVSLVVYVVLDVLLVLALLAYHRDAPPVRPGPWLLALPVGVAVLGGLVFLTVPADLYTFALLDWPGMCCVALVGAAAVHLVGRRTAAWSLALALLALAVLGMRAFTLADYVSAAPAAQRSTLWTLGIVEAGAVLAIAVPLAALANQALRRLPAPA